MAKRSDEDLASEFLHGLWLGGPRGQRRHVYLDFDSDREREARAALARLVRNYDQELGHAIRTRLAALIDPETIGEPRELVIRYRSVELRAGGKQPQYVRDVEIAFDIAAEVNEGGKVEAAIAEASKRFGVSLSTAKRAWSKYGKTWRIPKKLK